MGIFSFIKSQFIEVIEWTDNTTGTIVYNFPVMNKEIKMGAKLTVRESQVAIFISEGVLADVFQPGLYTLHTENMPILTKLKSWKYGFNSPFKAEVYFINTKQFTDQKWGTVNPIMMRDAEFGVLRLRAFGIYSYRVSDPVKFMKEVFSTNQVFSTDSITGQLKSSIVSGVADMLGEANTPAIDLARYYDELGKQALVKLQSRFEALGLILVSFYIENISLPEEVEKVLDKKTSMGVLGDMQQYAQYQSAEAIREAARNEGNSFAGAGIGLGAGAAMGNMMSQALSGSNQQTSVPTEANQTCPFCKASVPAGHKFCGACGRDMTPINIKCVKCGVDIVQGSKFCLECGASQAIDVKCPNCNKKIENNAKFCPDCGSNTNL